tara:strand:+ start:663 stop:842 length:180 start_codon:yes stop_codon:yes gene_type:complete
MPYSESRLFEKDESGFYTCPFCEKRYYRYGHFCLHVEKHLNDLLVKLEFIGKNEMRINN